LFNTRWSNSSFTLQTGRNFVTERARGDKRLDQSQVFNLFASISTLASSSYDHGLNHNEHTPICATRIAFYCTRPARCTATCNANLTDRGISLLAASTIKVSDERDNRVKSEISQDLILYFIIYIIYNSLNNFSK